METTLQSSKIQNSDVELKPNQPLIISPEGKSYLISTAKWSKFIAIVGFALLLITIVSGIFTLLLSYVIEEYQDFQIFQYFPASIYIIGVSNIVLALICFFPCLYLYIFSMKIKQGMVNDQQENLNTGLKHLKSTMKFIGILTIVMLALLLLLIPITIFSIGMLQALAGAY